LGLAGWLAGLAAEMRRPEEEEEEEEEELKEK